MNKIRFAFFGSADFSADFLEYIINDSELKNYLDLKFVVTQPDKPAGRKRIMTPTPVKQLAVKRGIAVKDYPLIEKVSKTGSKFGVLKLENIDRRDFEQLDLALVYAYGAIISSKIMELPRDGFWNIHPSLLPLYRGTAPMATPLIHGDKTTGVSIIKMDNKMDHGPIIVQESYTILNTDYRTDLESKLTTMGFELFKKKVLAGIDNVELTTQDEANATYTEKLKKEDGFIEFEELKMRIKESSGSLYDLYRGLYPWPGIWTVLPNKKRLKITGMELNEGKIILTRVQLEGKNEVDFKTFEKAYGLFYY